MTFNKKRIVQNQGKATKQAGTVFFTLRHPHADWTTNGNGYTFDTLNQPPVTVTATKQPDRTIMVEVDGPFDGGFMFHVPVPPCNSKGLRVTITWDNNTIALALNGEIVQSIAA